MLRSTSILASLALAVATFRADGTPARVRSDVGAIGSPMKSRVAFVPSPFSRPSNSKATTSQIIGRANGAIGGSKRRSRPVNSLAMIPSHPTSLSFPSVIASYDESIPEYQADQAFQDAVSLSDLTSDPVLQTAFAVAAVAIVLLFVAKAVVTQMDEAVENVAVDFDRVMKAKYPKKWRKFMDDDGDGDGGTNTIMNDDGDADRIQLVVEEMERLRNEEPEFMDRVMREVENPF
ncbi:hypothetical protein ACHAWF_010313 [Thalassiosira exigua]